MAESSIISNSNTIKQKEGFFQYVSLFGQMSAEELENPLYEMLGSSFILT